MDAVGRRLRLAAALLVAALVLLSAGRGAAQELPELTQPVNDFAGVIDGASAADMDRMIRALKEATGDVVVVATIPTFAPYGDIREYAVKLFENRGKGVGQKDKDNGLLVLLSVKEHRVWVEVGYGLEQWITDGFAGETSREYMIPFFKRDDYGGGLKAGVARIIGRIAEGRGVKLDGVKPAEKPKEPFDWGFGVLLAIVILIAYLRTRWHEGFVSRRRYWGGGGWSGWSSGVGGFGGGGGGFGGGFGGFGGGSSGGGGGGGSW